MPKVTYYKPNRTKIRHFTVKDLARIAKYVERDSGLSKLEIFAYMAVALGFGFLFCQIARYTASALSVTYWLQKIGIILSESLLLNVIIQTLIEAKVVAPPRVKIIIAIVVSAMALIDKIVSHISAISGDIKLMREAANTVNDLCKKVKEITGEAVDSACDASGDVCKNIRELGDRAAFEMKSDVDQAAELLGINFYDGWLYD